MEMEDTVNGPAGKIVIFLNRYFAEKEAKKLLRGKNERR